MFKCIVCDCTIQYDKKGFPEDIIIYDAIEFTSQGNYGSTKLDVFNNNIAEVLICDSCYQVHLSDSRYIRQRPTQ